MHNTIKMKVLLVFLFVAAAAALKVDDRFFLRHGIPPAKAPNARAARPTWGTISQKQDNFDSSNQNKWSMRYIENGQFFTPGSPIFIMLGAEWTIDEAWLQSGQMVDMAGMHHAIMYYTEHRYYGESYPTKDLKTASLKYLSVDQALADVAHFIVTMKENNPDLADSKVVVFGGSYGGTMATWMRQKYPDLVHSAVASSAPLLAKVDYHEYHGVVKDALGSECSSILMNASKEIRRLIEQGNKAKVEEDFQLCWPIKSEYDVQALFMSMAGSIGGQIQYAGPDTVSDICRELSNSNLPSDYDRLAAYSKDGYCKGNYEYMVDYMNNTSLYSGNGRQWFYQTCTNFGFFQTAWGVNSLYNNGISVDLYNQQCLDVFGPTITPELTAKEVAATNQEHGALNPGTTRLVSVHGSIDPWHAIGLPEDDDPSNPTYVVTGTSHCQDMYSMDTWNTEEMRDAKQAIVKYIADWLTEPY